MGLTLAMLGRPEEAVAAYGRAIDGYADDPAPALREQVGKALVSKGLTLAKLGATPDGQCVYEKLGFTLTSAPRMKLIL